MLRNPNTLHILIHNKTNTVNVLADKVGVIRNPSKRQIPEITCYEIRTKNDAVLKGGLTCIQSNHLSLGHSVWRYMSQRPTQRVCDLLFRSRECVIMITDRLSTTA